MAEFTETFKARLPNINTAKTLFCFSDYSGEEEQSNHFVYSFLILNGDNLPEWNKQRQALRNDILSDGRRVSYKNYRDKLSEKFIEKYLEIADDLDGYLITISVSKKLGSIFENNSAIDLTNPDFIKYSSWTKDTIEKTFRIMHFLSLFVSGLSSEYQNLFWITDNDKIAANNERITQLTELFASVMAIYLNHNLGHLKVGTTKSDDGSRLIEDLCSITDLAAGSYSDQHKTIETPSNKDLADIFWIYSPDYKKKTKNLIWWLSTSNKKLCKLCFKITENGDGKSGSSFYHFFNRE